MAGITSTGLGSGLDINSLVTQLVNAEIQPQQTTLTTRQSQIQAQVSALGSFKSSMSTLNDALTALTSGGALSGLQGSSADTSVLTASAGTGASAATYSVNVMALAASQKLGSQAYGNANALAIGTGTLSFTINGKSFDVAISAAGNTLNAIRDAINAAPDNAGVSASVVNGVDGAHLLLTAAQSGFANVITVTQGGGDGGLAGLVYDPAHSNTPMTQLQAAADAQIKIDGYVHNSSSNTVTDAVDGVTFNLLKAQPATAVNVSITADTSSKMKALGTFVTGYNAVITSLATLTSYDSTNKRAGALLGDPAVLSVGQMLRRLAGGAAGVTGAFQNLSQIGITSNADGTLKIDSGKISAALQNNGTDVSKLLGGTGGIMTQMASAASSFIGSTGPIQSETDGANGTLKDIQNQLTTLGKRSAQLQKAYLAQFNAMDTLVAQLRSTSDFLTQQLTGLQKAAGISRSN